MIGMSRRSFLGALGAAAGLGAFPPRALTRSENPGKRVRYEASSANGLAMLEIYREALGSMQSVSKFAWHHPLSWRFQANIHLFPASEPIDNEIFKLSGGGGDAEVKQHRKLALGSDVPGQLPGGIWGTCPHHEPGQYFLPWHRLFLTYFEKIIENVAGKPFSLPYWNYLDPRSRSLPEPFRQKAINGQANPLYFEFRTPQFLREGLNERILTVLQARNFQRLLQRQPLLSTRRRNGFSVELESTLHDLVHGAVGTSQGMGSVEFAARDPIFWLHHANIDRIWESWRQPTADGTSSHDPAREVPWRNAKFQFANTSGQAAEADVSFSLLAAANLGYQYESLEKVPRPMTVLAEQGGLKAPAMLWESGGPERTIRNPEDIVSIPLVPAQMHGAIPEFARNPALRYELSIDLYTDSEPGVYEVFVKSTAAAVGAGPAENKIGAFSLFSAKGDAHHAHGIAPGKADTTVKIDITDQVNEKVIDPARLGELIIRPAYLSETVDIVIKRVSILVK
jgi:hypothetical protein